MSYKYKQVIVMRKDLSMRKGKMIAQGAHASMKVLLDYMDKKEQAFRGSLSFHKYEAWYPNSINEWLSQNFAKICLYVNSEEELVELYKEARDANIPCALITDAGKTEFHGQPTKTCIAIGPDHVKKIDKITGHLKLL